MDVFGFVMAILLLAAIALWFLRSHPEILERIEALYEKIKYKILSVLLRERE